MKNKLVIILFLLGFCFLLFGEMTLAQDLELVYPDVEGAETPTTTKTLLPEYIRYLFNFAVITAGIIAFVSLVFGGFRYLSSAGNPTVMSDAKNQVQAGVLGLGIVLVSFLILTQINPQLINLEIGKTEFGKGIILYSDPGCPGEEEPEGQEGKDFLRVRSPMSSLGDFNGKAESMYVYDSSNEQDVKLYRDEDYINLFWETVYHDYYPRGECFPIDAPESVFIKWKFPGVYLFTDDSCNEDAHLFITDVSDFGSIGLHDQVKSIRILPAVERKIVCGIGDPSYPGCRRLEQCNEIGSDGQIPADVCKKQDVKVINKLGAVLHEHSNFEGDGEVFFGYEPTFPWAPQFLWCYQLKPKDNDCDNAINESYCRRTVGEDRASAITLFQQWQPTPANPAPTGGVTVFANKDLNEEGGTDDNVFCGPFSPDPLPLWVTDASNRDATDPTSACPYVLGSKRASSIRVEGDYIAVLFLDDGRAQVFEESDLRLKDDHVGNDEVEYMLVIPVIKQSF